jgi:hypothetical protein
MTSYKVGYFVGSLATASINRLLAGRSCVWRRRDSG